MKILRSYKNMIILIGAIIIGAVAGIMFGSDAKVVAPLGDLFLNLLLVSIVPLIFLNITTSIGKMKEPKRLGKIMRSIVLVFLVTSFLSVIVGFVGTYFVDLVNVKDVSDIKEVIVDEVEESDNELALLDRTLEVYITKRKVKFYLFASNIKGWHKETKIIKKIIYSTNFFFVILNPILINGS